MNNLSCHGVCHCSFSECSGDRGRTSCGISGKSVAEWTTFPSSPARPHWELRSHSAPGLYNTRYLCQSGFGGCRELNYCIRTWACTAGGSWKQVCDWTIIYWNDFCLQDILTLKWFGCLMKRRWRKTDEFRSIMIRTALAHSPLLKYNQGILGSINAVHPTGWDRRCAPPDSPCDSRTPNLRF